MTIDDIKKLIEVVRDTGIAELEVHWGQDSVRVKGAGTTSKEYSIPTVLPVPIAASGMPALAPMQPVTTPAPHTEPPPSPSVPATQKEEEESGVVVKSPIVGTYYDSPSPGMPSFVKVGDRVEPKQVLCIIESMKLMNEIEAEIAGTVAAKHVENGRPVEYGESLFTLLPL